MWYSGVFEGARSFLGERAQTIAPIFFKKDVKSGIVLGLEIPEPEFPVETLDLLSHELTFLIERDISNTLIWKQEYLAQYAIL